MCDSKLSPNTLATYEKFAKQKGFEPRLVDEEGVKGAWIGSPQAENTILWFHGVFCALISPSFLSLNLYSGLLIWYVIGGGYAFPAQEDHFRLLADLVHAVGSHGKELSALIIEYGKFA